MLHWWSFAWVEKGWQDRSNMWSEQTVVGIQPQTLFPGLLAGSSGLEIKFVSLPFSFSFSLPNRQIHYFLISFSFISCLPFPLSFIIRFTTFLVLMKWKNDEIYDAFILFFTFYYKIWVLALIVMILMLSENKEK